MKASELLEIIRENLKDYPIEYIKNKVTDERYKDPLTKRLARYNSEAYDEIYSGKIADDFEIKDNIIENISSDVDFYFERYAGGDEETREFTKNICLYLALIAKKPIHPYSADKTGDVYLLDGNYFCKGRIRYLKDERSLCRYCICKNVGFMDMF